MIKTNEIIDFGTYVINWQLIILDHLNKTISMNTTIIVNTYM